MYSVSSFRFRVLGFGLAREHFKVCTANYFLYRAEHAEHIGVPCLFIAAGCILYSLVHSLTSLTHTLSSGSVQTDFAAAISLTPSVI